MSIVLELPEELEATLREAWGDDVSRRILEAAVAEGYRKRLISRGGVQNLLGLSFWGTEQLLAEHGCMLHYSMEDLEEDRRNLEKVLGPVEKLEVAEAVTS